MIKIRVEYKDLALEVSIRDLLILAGIAISIIQMLLEHQV